MRDPGASGPSGGEQAAPVSRARYLRERTAREEAERLLEAKSRELFEANENLERLVLERTARLRDALQAAETAIAMRTRFLAVMSHEIRTPLGGVMGMLELLQETELTPAARDAISTAQQSAEALKHIVDDVLDLTSLDAGKMRFESEPVDLRAVVAGVFGLLAARATAKGLALETAIADDVPKLFLGDSARISQLVSNFADNAVKFTDSGSITVRATIESPAEGMWLRVAVEDTGLGISPAQQALLFTDFAQLESALSKRREGVGLGLSICRRIVEGLGGRIGVESAAGFGSCFWFELPIQPVPQDQEGAEAATGASDRVGQALRGKRILVAEDNAINRKIIGLFMERLEVAADFVEDGGQAVAAAAGERYDAIVMDVAMPGMDGIMAARAIRQGDGASRTTPIVALTAHVMGSVGEECREAGMAQVLTKPISFAALAQALAELTGAAGPERMETAPAPAAAMGSGALDPLVLRDLRAMMSDEAIARLLSEFLTDASNRMAVIRAAFARNDSVAVRMEAHSIRGAAGLVGATGMTELAAMLEDNADALDAEDGRVLLAEMQVAKRALRRLATGMASAA